MNCPACNRPMPENTLFVCPTCWPKVPAKERRALGAMHRHKQDTTSKVAKVVRILQERARGVNWRAP